ncbi:MAG: hypothetical protein AABX29_06510, partial [Nanoarchaeota archaeon]
MTGQPYQFKGNLCIDPSILSLFPSYGNLEYDERAKEILAVHNERFKGVRSIEDKTTYQNGQPISFSNIPRNLSYAQLI